MNSGKEGYIGIFDSGIGGLTVMAQIIKELPNENIFYYGDTARVPYGGKSGETIRRYTVESVLYMMERQLKALVIACNTATAHALDPLKRLFKLPILGVIEPGVEACLQAHSNERIGVIATQSTIASGAYQKAILQHLPSASIIAAACPLLVPLAEEQWWDHTITRAITKEYLTPLLKENITTLLLGCTHYPLLKKVIQEEAGPHVQLVDSAQACAARLKYLLNSHDLTNQSLSPGTHLFAASDDRERFKRLGSAFLQHPIKEVERGGIYI